MPLTATHGDALRIETGGSESLHLTAMGTLPGVVVLAAAGRNGPGMGRLKADETGTRLAWRAPGSATYGTPVVCSPDGLFLLEDGEDRDSWLRVHLRSAYAVPGHAEARIALGDRWANAVGHDDVTAGEASAGDVEDYTVTLANDSAAGLSQVKVWIDTAVSDLEISDDDITYVSPTTEGTALGLADIPAAGSITLYLRRTIGAAEPSDPDVLNHLHFSWQGI